jgi:branched-chain amino acid aminotransferase
LSIDNIIDAYKAGLLYEVFGTGSCHFHDRESSVIRFVMQFDVQLKTAPTMKWLTDIRKAGGGQIQLDAEGVTG